METNDYMSGFGNQFESEAEGGALPKGCNNPQKAPKGLYAEQLSGAAFTALPHENQRSWLYRTLPSVKHSPYEALANSHIQSAPNSNVELTPEQLRWSPQPDSAGEQSFFESMWTYCLNGDVLAQSGSAIHSYNANKDMSDESFFNHDGDFLIVPQLGKLEIQTELGRLSVEPGEIAVVQRGIAMSVGLPDKSARGYICENYGAHFQLPYRGPIGANGLANSRDFLTPCASYESNTGEHRVVSKFGGRLFSSVRDHSPFNVVAWHGNYAPYKYDLRLFNTIGSISYDHPDPSIFTVLTSPSLRPGVANIDFVIFPPRWMVAEDTFRPPWYHRNIMSEFMGLVYGIYDAKPGEGFLPGGASLHNCMSAHGPDSDAFAHASSEALEPIKQKDTMAFMFESSLVYQPTTFAYKHPSRQTNYLDCWQGLKNNFHLGDR